MIHQLEAIVWDFDGVVNRNYGSHGFFWAAELEQHHGITLRDLARRLFGDGLIQPVIAGKGDLHDLLEEVLAELGCRTPAAEFIRYWFERDAAYLCPEILGMIAEARALGVRNVLGTNSEAHRVAFLRDTQRLGDHLDHLFGSGPLGAAKPTPGFYRAIAHELGITDPSRILLVDDTPENIEGAHAAGWQAILYGDFTRLTLGDPAELRARLGLSPR